MFIVAIMIVTSAFGAILGWLISHQSGHSPMVGIMTGGLSIFCVIAISFAIMVGTSSASDEIESQTPDVVSGVLTHSIVSE